VFFVRNGRLIGRDYFVLQGADEEDEATVVTEFVQRFYAEAASIPSEIILPVALVADEEPAISAWLRERHGGRKVRLTVPKRGSKRKLLKMAYDNGQETLAMLRAQWESDPHRQEQAIAELQQALGLDRPPNRIECYDISNTQGTAITASRVVFVQGTPQKKEYRRFSIRTVQGPDDYGSMREALTRRFRRYATTDPDAETTTAPGKSDSNETWRILPDLLIVDGGKGQLNVAVEVLESFDLLDKVPVAGLAKQFEELYRPGQSHPVILPRRSQALYMVQRVRDEAHRFALALHRKQRAKASMASQLEQIPGIGPARRKALLKTFGSLDGIRDATVDALMTVPGITAALAEAIKAGL
jgi:excinuclease ABC subunit C